MQSNNPGRHRKPKSSGAIAARAALSTGAAVAAVVAFAPAASAGTSPTVNPLPCTGTPFDTATKSITGSFCGTGPGGGVVLR